ncbi:hypothetical protein GNQ68_13540 [Pseudomonas aeruginosa]|nr:hypothetical protein [Pseudomonas aeruginosa]
MGCPCMVEGAPPRRCPESPARLGETRHRVAQIGTRGATSRSAPAQVAARQPTRLAGSTPPVETWP